MRDKDPSKSYFACFRLWHGRCICFFLGEESECRESDHGVRRPSPAAADRERMMSRIVIAEDDPSALARLQALLVAWGYEVETAPDGRAALDMVSAVHPRVVITDLVMPSMTGLELLSILHEEEPELPVILLTSHGSPDTQGEATRQGAYAYLRKPVDVSTLKMVLASVLAE